jgi:hypothetical protein
MVSSTAYSETRLDAGGGTTKPDQYKSYDR